MDEYSVNLPGVLTGYKTRAFESLIRGIGEAKSKHEEDRIIHAELLSLKEQFVSAKVSLKKTRELLIRLIYCEILGYDGSFGYIHAIKLAQQPSLMEKRTGYLAASIFLHKDHQLVLLLINTLQKDLKSTNVVAKSAALTSICKLVGAEMAPALMPLILAALKDKRAEIRKKSLMALQQMYRVSHSLVEDIATFLVDLICDNDPAVMSASLHMFYDLVKEDPKPYRKYSKAFIQILMQIMENELPGYNYHGVQAPWIQIKLLKILALIGKQHKSTSESMTTVLSQMIHTLPTDCNIGCAVMFECLQTVTTIYPMKSLLDIASRKATLFLTSDSSNLKCSGIRAITSLAEIDPCYAADSKRQNIIIDCLDDDDLTIKKKTLELLYRITNNTNVDLVSSKLLNYLSLTTEYYIKMEVATKLTELAEKYAPTSLWYIGTINNVIQVADQCIPPQLIHNLMKLISTAEEVVKREAVSRYIDLIDKKYLPDSLVQLSCWVIGEFAFLLQDDRPLQDILCKLACLLDRKFTDPESRGWIVTSVAKLTARTGIYCPEARGIIERYRSGFPPELRQRCYEVSMLAGDMSLMQQVFPVIDQDGQDIQLLSSLSFLDDFVSEALMNGACPYQPHIKRNQEEPEQQQEKSPILIKPYEEPFKKIKAPIKSVDPPKPVQEPRSKPPNKQPITKKLPRKVTNPPRKVWGREGYLGTMVKKQEGHFKESLKNPGESSSNSSSSVQQSLKTDEEDEKRRDEVVSQSNTDPGPKHALFSGLTSPKELLETTSVSSENLGETSSESTSESRDSEPRDNESHATGSRDNESPLLIIDEGHSQCPKQLLFQISSEEETFTDHSVVDSVNPNTNQLQQTSTEGTEFENNLILTAKELNTESANSDNFFQTTSEKTDCDFLQTTKLVTQTPNTDPLYQTTDRTNPDYDFAATTIDLNTENAKPDDLFQAGSESTNFDSEFLLTTKLHNQSLNTDVLCQTSPQKANSDNVVAVTTKELQTQSPNADLCGINSGRTNSDSVSTATPKGLQTQNPNADFLSQTSSHTTNSDNNLVGTTIVLDTQNANNDLVVSADMPELVGRSSIEDQGFQASSEETSFEDDLVVLKPNDNDEQNKQERNVTTNVVEQSGLLVEFTENETSLKPVCEMKAIVGQTEVGYQESSLVTTMETKLKGIVWNKDEDGADDSLTNVQEVSNDLCSDSNVRLVYKTVHKPNKLILELKLTNHSQSRDSVERLSLLVEPPSNLVANTGSNCLEVETLSFLDTIKHEVELSWQYPALHMSFKGTVKYTISKTSKVLYFNQEIPNKELLRPFHTSTEVFGEKWTSMTNDVRQTVTMTSSKRCDDVMQAMTQHLNLAIVDIIGSEGIVSGTVLGRNICLLHLIFHKNIDIWVKSTSKLQSEIILKECVHFLKNYCK